jgi:hypothetical protein
MKKILRNFAFLVALTSLIACAGKDVVERAKHEINPLIGGTSSKIVWVSDSNEEDPYILRFAVEFERPLEADAFWTYDGTRKLIRDGITIHAMDKLGYVKLFTLDMREVLKKTESFATPIELNLGYNNPISGYPSFHKIAIHENKNIPEEKRHACFEATCLEIVVLEWNNEKQAYDEEYVTPSRPLNKN